MIKAANGLFEKFKCGELELDLGGHHSTNIGSVTFNKTDSFFEFLFLGEIGDSCMTSLVYRVSSGYDTRLYDELEQLLVDNFPVFLERTLSENKPLIIGTTTCSECGERCKLHYDGKRIYTNTCKYPGGLKPWAVEIDVPSGKLVFRNDMRKLFPKQEKNVSVNNTLGIKTTEEFHATNGMFHVFVGNTCPGIYQMPNGNVIVGRLFDEDEPIKDKYKEAKKLGSICTDLWWFSACDYDEFVKRSGGLPSKCGWVSDVVVKLPKPGRYKLTSYYATDDNVLEFAVIEEIQ
jgi:hypothetical protein